MRNNLYFIEPSAETNQRRLPWRARTAGSDSGGSRSCPTLRALRARLRATTLVGLDPANRHLSYMWDRDGAYEVAVSGRYEHSVSGSAIGGGALRLSSTLTYTRLLEGSGQ